MTTSVLRYWMRLHRAGASLVKLIRPTSVERSGRLPTRFAPIIRTPRPLRWSGVFGGAWQQCRP